MVPVAKTVLKVPCLQNHCSSAGNEGFVLLYLLAKATQSILQITTVGEKVKVSGMRH